MKKFKKLSAVLSVILCMSMLMGMGSVFASEEKVNMDEGIQQSFAGALSEIREEIGVDFEITDMSVIIENNISPEEFKEAAIEQITNYFAEIGLSINSKENDPIMLNVVARSSYPPGSVLENNSGSGSGGVWAGIPALGITTLYIDYDYDYTKWHHDLYQVHGCDINSSSRVTGSYLDGASLGQWTHRSGTIAYDTKYGETLKITATGSLLFGISVTLDLGFIEVSIPANVSTVQSFAYFHDI